MANRQVSIFINGKEVANQIKSITAEKAKLNRELNRMIVGSAEYEAHIKQIGRLDDTLNAHRQKLRGVESSWKSVTSSAANFLGAAGIAFAADQIISGLINTGREMAQLYDTAAKTDAQLKSALKSTGEVAGRSFEQLNAQAEQLQKFTLFDDDATKQAQALLLTFTKVRTEVFDDTIPLIQDYATAMATATGGTADLKGATIQVGKALQDPIKGITALGKAGVQFSEQQKEQIKGFVETGRVADAQRIILGELETQFGGSAKAAAEAGLGGFQVFQNRIDNIKETLGEGVVDALNEFSPAIDTALTGIEDFLAAEKSGKEATTQFGTTLQVLSGIVGSVASAMDYVYRNVARFAIFLIKGASEAVEFITLKFAGLYNTSVDLSNKLREFAGLKPLEIKIDVEKFKAGSDKIQKILEDALNTKTVAPEKKTEGVGGKSFTVLKAEEEAKQVGSIRKKARDKELEEQKKQQEKEEELRQQKAARDREAEAKDIEERAAAYDAELSAFSEHLLAMNEAEMEAEELGKSIQKDLEGELRDAAIELRDADTEDERAAAQKKFDALLDAAKAYGVDVQKILDEVAASQDDTTKKLTEDQKKRLENVQKTIASLEKVQSVVGSINEAIIAAGLENTKFGKALAAAQIAISGAVAVAKGVESAIGVPFPANLVAIATVVGAVVTTIASAKKALEGATVPQRKHGGFADVRGADDGQLYHAKLIGQPSTGMLDYPHPVLTSSGILANEVGREYYVSHSDLRNPRILDHVRAIENISTHRQRAEGGFASTSPTQNVAAPAGAGTDPELKQLLLLSIELNTRLLTEGVRVDIGPDELLAMQRQIAKLNKVSGGRL
jgi:hypothetical protein